MKKLDKLEKYVRVPDTQFYGAYFYDGEDILLHDEVEEFNDEKGNLESRLTIKDTIENGVFKKYKLFEDIKNNAKEETKREFAVKEGDMLIFVMYEGFTKTHTPLITINSAIDRLKMLDSRNYDEKGELKK
ncbi:MAG: hypothetical protein PUJ51_12575 [Clostridiales bacterium]|uniref:hypothetical protein n=1 Tax=Terrisporobacter sp. TaxID=1965305 RepID=UPI002A596DC0|nr:hypothetical protein [Terrisporobacter sp.]MDD7755321.1 hypothetical protein [Clostridiales bacterium]MDY4136320.1 hypothetical protein [Terrisporobacter sp.]